MPSPTRRTATSALRRLLLLLVPVLAAGLFGALATPGAAHPFGDPQTLDISVSGDEVTVVWQAAADDYTSLALRLDVVEGPRRMVFKDGALVPEVVDARDAEQLAASPALGAYLLSVLTVTQGDVDCVGRLQDPVELAERGATLIFSCPARIDRVRVGATPLVDMHPAYTTLATGPGGATHVFSADSVTHDFAVEPDGATLRSSAVTLAAAGGAVVLLGLGAWFVRRRRAGRAADGGASC